MPHPPFIMLDEKSDVPLYRQIYEAIRRAILHGKFHSTMPLPATRVLAKQLRVSRMTVVNAYDQLLAEGYLESRTGAGTFVAAHLPEEFLQTPRVERGENQKKIISRRIKVSDYGKKLSENGTRFLRNHGATVLVPFQHGVSAIDKFPFEIWAKISQKLQKSPPASFLAYGEPTGFQPLREAVAAHLASARGVSCTAEQIIITNGTQQALDLIGRIFLEKGEEFWIEDPCYSGARNIFEATGAKLVPVPVDGEGFDLNLARKKSKQARLVYVTPSHQYPLGVTMSLARRLKLLEWARETDSFIVEDDYNSEYRYGGRPLASLQGLDRDERVIYLGTFSKTIFPSVRLGCLVVPPDLVDMFAAARAMSDLHSPTIDQAILAEFIAGGHFARHTRRMCGIYEERQQILVEEMQKHLKGIVEIAPAESGMDLVGWLPEGVNDREVSRSAAKVNLKIAPISAFCINQNLRGGMLLGYTAFNEKQIRQGVKKLARVINEII
ncbi:MAG: PLP-dependent aminotransferase family protein [Pyrinomonadaceae bacterium]